ncbi:hypothetical protein BP5796_06914 [Coleophoma crateriformis]|uniref:Rhodopsin domain-containing protein n=1 Tax=Coleophoma crateriformis TaxID=565419 RepID=A0A3D8RPV6_9HELO|nr:hypothetical protein BP5796_06914 [Coleophoma crateriformis]
MPLKLPATIGLECFLIFLPLVFIVGRIYVRLYKLNTVLNASDYFVFIGWFCLLGWAISTGLALKFNGYSWADSSSDELNGQLQRCLFAAEILFDIGLYFPKFSLLALYFVIIKDCFRKTRIALRVITTFIALASLTVMVLDFAICEPFSLQFSLIPGQCSSWTSWVTFDTNFVLNMVCDILVFALPFSFLGKMKISKKARIGLIGTFALGVVTILVGAMRYTLGVVYWDLPTTIVCTTAELCCALIVVSLPILRHLFGESVKEKGNRLINSSCQQQQVSSSENPVSDNCLALDMSSWA